MPDRRTIPRIESLHVKNYRALCDVELKNITPLTVFLGPNGSGKSTIFDVFAFLSDCFDTGLRKAWNDRGRFKELKTRESDGFIEFELKYRERPNTPVMTYHLSIGERQNNPYVAEEYLAWRRGRRGKPFRFLDFKDGQGRVISGDEPEKTDIRVEENLISPEVLAVNTLGQLARHPRVNALRNFITGWHMSYLSADNTRGIPESGPQERLSQIGDNLPNVIQYLSEQHPAQLARILQTLSSRVPLLNNVTAKPTFDGRLVLQIKDGPFEEPVMAKWASDGTLKMLAYLTVLYDPNPPPLIGIEEPENQLHPKLLLDLAEECRHASATTQLMITTHSPYFVNGLEPEELRVLYRDDQGYTQTKRAADMQGITEHIKYGAALGDLWMEGYFEFGNPLKNAGKPKGA
ncbi:AAA family ATPase [Chloroflexota bacterium]